MSSKKFQKCIEFIFNDSLRFQRQGPGRRISEAGETDRRLQVRASFSRLFPMGRRVAIAVLPTFVSVQPDIFQTAQPAAPLRGLNGSPQ
jgi:hypothetical protein